MESHLLQMRGLKPEQVVIINIWPESHLLQMRGLKQQADSAFNKQYEVASFTDAWIET